MKKITDPWVVHQDANTPAPKIHPWLPPQIHCVSLLHDSVIPCSCYPDMMEAGARSLEPLFVMDFKHFAWAGVMVLQLTSNLTPCFLYHPPLGYTTALYSRLYSEFCTIEKIDIRLY